MATLDAGIEVAELGYASPGVIFAAEPQLFAKGITESEIVLVGSGAIVVESSSCVFARISPEQSLLSQASELELTINFADILNNTLANIEVVSVLGAAGPQLPLELYDGYLKPKSVSITGVFPVSQIDVFYVTPVVVGSSVTYYLRGYNATTEQFEFWSSVGVADVSGVAHLQAVRIVGITD